MQEMLSTGERGDVSASPLDTVMEYPYLYLYKNIYISESEYDSDHITTCEIRTQE